MSSPKRAKRSRGFESTPSVFWTVTCSPEAIYQRRVEADGLVWRLSIKFGHQIWPMTVSITAQLEASSDCSDWEVVYFESNKGMRKIREGESGEWETRGEKSIDVRFVIIYLPKLTPPSPITAPPSPPKADLPIGAPSYPWTNLGRLLNEVGEGETKPLFEDFELRNDGKSLRIHRAIFAAASDVFRKLFVEDMAERRQGFAEVADVRMEVLAELKSFLYTGRLGPEAEENVEDLLYAADKYRIPELKEACGEAMAEALSTASLCRTAVLAERFGVENLRSACGELLRGLSKAQQTALPDWAQLRKDHPALILDLLGL